MDLTTDVTVIVAEPEVLTSGSREKTLKDMVATYHNVDTDAMKISATLMKSSSNRV